MARNEAPGEAWSQAVMVAKVNALPSIYFIVAAHIAPAAQGLGMTSA